MAGIRLEFAQFGDFDYFDILRSNTPMNINSLPSPIKTGLMKMYYMDTTVVTGATYYYRVVARRGSSYAVSDEVQVKAQSAVYARYIKIIIANTQITTNTVSDYTSMREIEIMAHTDRVNLARAAVVTATSTSAFSVNNLVDGDTSENTTWASSPFKSTQPQTLFFDLGMVAAISKIKMHPQTVVGNPDRNDLRTRAPKDFTISVSSDNSIWTEVQVSNGVTDWNTSSIPSFKTIELATYDADFVSNYVVSDLRFISDITDRAGKVAWQLTTGATLVTNPTYPTRKAILCNGGGIKTTTIPDWRMMSDYCVELVLKPTTLTGLRVILGQIDSATYAPFRLELNNGNYNVLIGDQASTSWAGSTDTLTAPPSGGVDRLVLIRKAGTLYLYANNRLVGSRASEIYNNNKASVALLLGASATGMDSFAGYIYAMRITNMDHRYSDTTFDDLMTLS